MSWVVSFEEWLEGLHKDYRECKDPVKSLRAAWDSALESAAWAIHDADPRTYPERERIMEPNESTDKAFAVAEAAVRSLTATKKEPA